MGWKLPTLVTVLWVVALGMWAAFATGPVGGPWGAAAGSVLTLLAGVVTAYIPSFRDEYQRRVAEVEQARGALRRAGELPLTGGPAGLLDPRRGVAGFLGRERELAGLVAWCGDGRARGVRLVTGPGGVGKTRLSVELCARMTVLGWRCVRPGDGGEAGALEAARRVHRGRVLLVVDYAETRAGLGGLLRAVAADDGTVRVLLLARSAGEWWERLATAEPAVRELLAAAGTGDPLPVPVAEGLSNDEVIAAAVPAFAAALGVAAPAGVEVQAGAGAVAVRVLDLHAAALVAVLHSAGANGPVTVRVADVLDELLGHEVRFWQGSAARLGLTDGAAGLSARELRRLVAAGALLGASSQMEAVELLGRAGVAGSARLAEWLRDLYPPAEGSEADWLGSLAPDRLAERLVVAELGADAELAGRCLTGLDKRQALRAVTVLGRAAADEEDAGGLLKRLLPLVEQVVAGLPADLGLLTAISNAIPYPSVALAGTDLAVTRRILSILTPGQSALRALWLSGLGVTLAQTGQAGQALSAEHEAAAIYLELAATYPDQYRPDLATALTNLGVTLSALGRPVEALPVTREAVAIYRELAAAYPNQYRPALATALSSLGVTFSALGRPVEALPVTEEAAAIQRGLAAAYPDRYRPDLAGSLSNLGGRLRQLGRPAEALPVTEEAAAMHRELAAAYPDRYRPDLAGSLSNLGIAFSELGRPAEALPVTEEALSIYRELAAAYPDRYRPDVARSLSNLGSRFRELGRSAEALPGEQEAVAMHRELAAAYPDRYRPDLAGSLSNLGITFSELGRPAEALPVTEEALSIYRELAAAYPDRYRPDVARSLSNLGNRFSALGRPAEALPGEQEAVAIFRELAAAYPDRYRPDLAASLSNLGITFSELGRPAEALPVTEEALTIYRELAAAYPDRYRPDLARSLSNLGNRFTELGRPAEALPVTEEALTIYRELAATYPDRYRPDLARSLHVHAAALELEGRKAEADAARQEAG